MSLISADSSQTNEHSHDSSISQSVKKSFPVFPECCLQGAASVPGVTEDVNGVRLQSDVQPPRVPDAFHRLTRTSTSSWEPVTGY